MSSVNNFDRDLRWIGFDTGDSLQTPHTAFASTHKVRSDGVVYTQEAHVFRNSRATEAFAADDCTTFGVHLTGPDDTNGSPYRIKGFAKANANYDIYILIGIGPASPSSSAAGDDILFHQYLAASLGSEPVTFDETLYIKPFGIISSTDYSDRVLTAAMLWHNTSGGATSDRILGQLSVQRLSVKPPEYNTAVR
jgi:hypothetical protein